MITIDQPRVLANARAIEARRITVRRQDGALVDRFDIFRRRGSTDRWTAWTTDTFSFTIARRRRLITRLLQGTQAPTLG